MKIVTFGDSVVWGQGLYPQQKFAWQVYRTLAGSDPTPDTLQAYAHSGATIGVGATISKPALDGEVPDSYPTILQQCSGYQGATDDVDLVIVDGGINDVNSFILDNPFLDHDDLQERIVKHCYNDMLALLDAVTTKFSNARTRIVLLGYYQILSTYSDRELVPHVCGLHGLDLLGMLEKLGDMVLDKIFSQHAFFAEQSAANLRRAADETNQRLGSQRITFVLPPFSPQNSMLAADSWIFGIDKDLQPEDPFAADRHAVCDRDETDLIQRHICYLASVGHPNVIGAQKIAAAIVVALGQST
ncbi:MAG: SGNH/GDSL hydrolase family protein [Burkholderiaceae bacterium]|nr:SGNH/GDSL hydrolase family protein [Burkholderiaceae bacterium]